MILRGRLPLFVVCLVLAAIASEAPGRAAGGAGAGVPLLTSATADLDAGTLTIVGQNFVSSPLPRVYMGTEAGGLIELSWTARPRPPSSHAWPERRWAPIA